MNSAYSIPLDADRLCFQGISFNAAKELSVFQLTLKFEPTCQEGRRFFAVYRAISPIRKCANIFNHFHALFKWIHLPMQGILYT